MVSWCVQMQYDVYRPDGASDEDFNATHQFFLQVEEEDKFLCVSSPSSTFIPNFGSSDSFIYSQQTNAQKNMEAGIYQTGSLHTVRRPSQPMSQERFH